MEETFSNMVIQRMEANCGLGMLKFDKKAVKLDLIILLKILDDQIGIKGRE